MLKSILSYLKMEVARDLANVFTFIVRGDIAIFRDKVKSGVRCTQTLALPRVRSNVECLDNVSADGTAWNKGTENIPEIGKTWSEKFVHV